MIKALTLGTALLVGLPATGTAQYQGWRHSGSFFILTTPDGADLPAAVTEQGFPLLVRLDKDWFDFKEVKAAGEDLRFAAAGKPLAYQIDAWDLAAGAASIWLRVPVIKGNAQQEITMFWGKVDAAAESNGKAVFNDSNGYLSVFHLDDPLKDETGTLAARDLGTTPAAGVFGQGRHFETGKGILGGENITTYPTGAGPHSTELWFKAAKSGDRIVCWGNGEPKAVVQMILNKPPRISMDCYHSGANLTATSTIPLSEWVQVIHTYQKGDSRVYVNGRLDGVSTTPNDPLEIRSPAKMYLGGWGNYVFNGDMDEVRVSKVTRSADWVKLQYENQKPQQTVVGPLVQPGTGFLLSEKSITLLEGKTLTVKAKAGGARKIYWIIKRGGRETIAAVDRFSYTLDAGRVTADETCTLQCKAVFADGPKTIDIPVTIKEGIPEPVFTVQAPATWNGRDPIEVVPRIANLQAMQAAQGAGELNYQWRAAGLAVIQQTAPGKLILQRAQNSGTLTVTATISNGGKPVSQAVRIVVKEPVRDAWVQRVADKEEKPVDNQFYARDDHDEGTLHYNGTLSEPADAVVLKLYADDKLIKTESRKPAADKSYAFALKLKPGLIKYKVEFGTRRGSTDKIQQTVTNLVCGDAYVVQGQSNAVAYNYHNNTQRPDLIDYTSDWIRSYGSGGEAGEDTTNGGWGNAVLTNLKVNNRGGVHFVGVWPMVIAKQLVADHKIPICILNGAVGGTRIDQHLPDPADRLNTTDSAHSIYRNLLRRVVAARLTHGIRGVLWHQGESDQGFDGPDNCYGCETYQQYFIDLSAAWKQDFPNLRHYYVYQIWPNACSMGGNGASDKLREVERRLARLYSSLSVMPTLDLPSGQNCHFVLEDYEKMGLAMVPLIERDAYGKLSARPVTAPDLLRAWFPTAAKDEIALEFDQPVVWMDALAGQFYLDGAAGQVAGGAVAGNRLTLKLAAPATAKTVTYLIDKKWDPKTLLYGKNGIAALTFCEVPVEVGKE